MTNLMEAEVLFYDPDLDFDPAIQALTKLGLEIEVQDRVDARIKISIVTDFSEDDFHAWVDALPLLIEHDGEVLSSGLADRAN
jgi:hypothetical protein